MVKRMVLMLLGVGLLFFLIFGFGAVRAHFIGKFLKQFSNPPQTVTTMKAETSAWQPSQSAVGSIVAVNGASLSAEVAGIVDKISFESGADVPAGALIVSLRENNAPAVLAQLQATASLDQITYNRDQQQFKADAVSQAQVDTDRANLAAANAQVQAQQALIAEMQIRAPFAGRLGVRQVDLGQFVAAGTAVVSLQQLDPLFVDFYLPQQALSTVAAGQAVQVTVDAFPGRRFPGTVTAIASSVDTATRNVQIRATLHNPGLVLRPGMFATVALANGAPSDYVTLPLTAVAYNSYGDTVWVAQPAKDAQGHDQLVAAQVFVQLGDTRGDQVAVTSGITPGTQVVTSGQLKLKNGTVLKVDNGTLPPNSPNPDLPNE